MNLSKALNVTGNIFVISFGHIFASIFFFSAKQLFCILFLSHAFGFCFHSTSSLFAIFLYSSLTLFADDNCQAFWNVDKSKRQTNGMNRRRKKNVYTRKKWKMRFCRKCDCICMCENLDFFSSRLTRFTRFDHHIFQNIFQLVYSKTQLLFGWPQCHCQQHRSASHY